MGVAGQVKPQRATLEKKPPAVPHPMAERQDAPQQLAHCLVASERAARRAGLPLPAQPTAMEKELSYALLDW